MQIAQASDKNCTARAISTMRLALGYETGLPKSWGEMGGKNSEEFITLLGDCFPDRTILLVCLPDVMRKASLADNIRYIGIDWPSIRPIDWDEYLIAFSYSDFEIDESYMVIGVPDNLSGKIRISLIFGVSLQKRNAT